VDHPLIVAGRLRTDDPLKADSPLNEGMNAGVLPNADARKLDHRRELNARSVAEASDRNHRQHRVNVLPVRHSNNRRLNVEEADRLSRRRSPRRVRCNREEIVARNPLNPNAPHDPRHNKSNVLRDRRNSSSNNSNGRNDNLRLNALLDQSNNGRRANALVVQRNDRSKTRSRNSNRSRRSTRVVHRLNAAVAAVKVNPASPANRKRDGASCAVEEEHGW
jgi:hypothetical protein